MDTCGIILGFILGVIASFFGAWFSHFFGERRRRQEDFNKAAAQFRKGFLPEIVYLKRNAVLPGHEIGSSNLRDFLFSAYHRHLEALETFHSHLSVADRKGIDKTWKDYCQDSQGNLNFEQYSCLMGGMGGEKAETLKQRALSRIESILKFADPMGVM